MGVRSPGCDTCLAPPPPPHAADALTEGLGVPYGDVVVGKRWSCSAERMLPRGSPPMETGHTRAPMAGWVSAHTGIREGDQGAMCTCACCRGGPLLFPGVQAVEWVGPPADPIQWLVPGRRWGVSAFPCQSCRLWTGLLGGQEGLGFP